MGERGGEGDNRCPNTHTHTQKYAQTHVQYTKYIDFCFTHERREANTSSHTHMQMYTQTHTNMHA